MGEGTEFGVTPATHSSGGLRQGKSVAETSLGEYSGESGDPAALCVPHPLIGSRDSGSGGSACNSAVTRARYADSDGVASPPGFG